MNEKTKNLAISKGTLQKVQAAKNFIEQRYSKLLQQEQQKKQYWQQLNRKMQTLNMSLEEQESLKKRINHEQAELMRQQRVKLCIQDFHSVKVIGKGAFGEVRLCKWKKNGEPVAIKKLRKQEMIFKNKVIQSREQRNVLAISEKNPWIVSLKCSFQDSENLYLVMEYLPGGDLMNLLMKKDIFTHEQAQFYTAQILLALDSVHKMKYIHRDLKPDNVLLDVNGHIKLSDFGLCKHTEIRPKKLTDNLLKKQSEQFVPTKKIQKNQLGRDYHKRNRKLAYSAVGTPDYVAPEVQGRVGYTQTVDWWSMGVILYEMLVGYPPFASEQARQTWYKIQNWRKYLVIPRDADVSPQAADLIRRLITDPKDRLGINGVQQIQEHPFFIGINWSKLRNKQSPYIPEVKNAWDTANFDQYEEEQPWVLANSKGKSFKNKNTEFIGYTYKPMEENNSALLKALLDLDNCVIPKLTNQNQNNLQYLQLERNEQINYEIGSINRFKKDKTDRTNKDFYATTALMNTKKGDKNIVGDGKYKCYYGDTPQKKGSGIQGQKLTVKKQSPSNRVRDEKQMKVKILQKKFI